MAIYDSCDQLPYTISIQINKEDLITIEEMMQKQNLKNHVSDHISIKYLGYEKDLSRSRAEKIVSILRRNKEAYQKPEIRISGFEVMKSTNQFYHQLLYLVPEPHEDLKNLHYTITNLLEGIIDIYRSTDYTHYIPHISCGHINDSDIINTLNEDYKKLEPIIIKEWKMVFHTSEYEITIL